MAWYLNRALTNFRLAVNAAYPRRDKTSDGTIGDAAHQAGTSDHNEDPDGSVDAWDMDVDLRSADDPAAIEHLKQVFQAHPAARYWIHNGQIAHRSTGWRREPYQGINRHDKHVHWNSNEATEDSTVPWVIEEDEMSVKAESQVDSIFAGMFYGGNSMGRSVDPDGTAGRPAGNSLVAKLDYVMGRLDAVEKRLANPTPVTVDPAAVAAALPAELADRIADRIAARLAE